MKLARYKKTNNVWFHLNEVSEIGKLIKLESRLGVDKKESKLERLPRSGKRKK